MGADSGRSTDRYAYLLSKFETITSGERSGQKEKEQKVQDVVVGLKLGVKSSGLRPFFF